MNLEPMRECAAMLTIRPAAIRDIGAITAIYNEEVRTSTSTFDTLVRSEDERLAWLLAHDARHPVVVAEWNGQVVGWAALSRWSDRKAYDDTAESSFYVHQAYRGRGFGRRLKEHILAEGRRLGLHAVIARVSEGNLASLHINASCGFVQIGVLKQVGHKFGQRLDVHLMQYIYQE